MNFEHGGGQISFARSTHELIPFSHFQNDCAAGTSADTISNSIICMLLKLKRDGGKEVGNGQRRVFIK